MSLLRQIRTNMYLNPFNSRRLEAPTSGFRVLLLFRFCTDHDFESTLEELTEIFPIQQFQVIAVEASIKPDRCCNGADDCSH